MKKLLFIFLLLIFSALTYLYQETASTPHTAYSGKNAPKDSIYLPSHHRTSTSYQINTVFDDKSGTIKTKEKIFWINISDAHVDNIHLHLYANCLKSRLTEIGKSIDLSDENKTEFLFKSLTVNGRNNQLRFLQTETNNAFDSTLAEILLDNRASPGDTVIIEFEYSLKIPVSLIGLGKARGAEFYLMDLWYPQIAVCDDGKWKGSQFLPFADRFNEFADYEVSIQIPEKYDIAASGNLISQTKVNSQIRYTFSGRMLPEFVFAFSNNFLIESSEVTLSENRTIKISCFIQPGNERYSKRIISLAENAITYLNNNFGDYPFDKLLIIDKPRSFKSISNSYPGIILYGSPVFSPPHIQNIEKQITDGLALQFFSEAIGVNSVYEAWMTYGPAEYASIKALDELMGRPVLHFNFAGFIPVSGILFSAYKEIPIIYSLTGIPLPEGNDSFIEYYSNPTISINDTTFRLPDFKSYSICVKHKPALMFLSLERIIGRDKLFAALSNYYNKFKFRYPDKAELLSLISDNAHVNLNWFIESTINKSKIFDFKIKSVREAASGEYEVMVERVGEPGFETEVVLYTDKDTLTQKWNGIESWKVFKFKTNNQIIAAEIDPERKNLFDIHYSNNSYMVDPNYWASMSLAIRWFFWVQNALMILGSIG